MKRYWFALIHTLLVFSVLFLSACGSPRSSKTQPGKSSFDLEVVGQTVIKVRTNGDGIVALEEKLHSIFEDGPLRTLAVVRDGQVANTFVAPAGWSLVDFAVHPSGAITIALTNAREVRIMRLDANGAARTDQPLVDASAPNDPYFNYTNSLKDDTALQPVLMHDAARLAPLGESVAVVLRTGRNAVVAYRFDPDASGAYHNVWRTLVEPGSPILAVGITSGSFDTFGQLQNHIQIFADADADSTLAVGVIEAEQSNFIFRAHTDYFGKPIAATVGVLLTRINADGQRLGTTVIDTHQRAELHGLRATLNGFAMVGRVLSEVRPDGSGWDAFVVTIARDGTATAYHVVDVNKGDILFDVTALTDGRHIAVGTTAYLQNPTGESISEDSMPLVAILNADGSLARTIGFPSGPRQNQITAIAPFQASWLLGGMTNGPGTHSGDGDRTLITADGFVRQDTDLPQ